MGAERCGQDGLGDRAPRLEQTGGRALWLGQTWEVAACEIAHLESYYFGKYHQKVDAWEHALGKFLTSKKQEIKSVNIGYSD